MDVTLDKTVTAEEFLAAMNAAMPPDMQLSSAKALDDRHPALMAMVRAASYQLHVLDEDAAQKCITAIPAFLQQESIMAMRKTKSGVKECDIRPLIHALRGENGCLYATLTLTESTACKPDMLLNALCGFAGCEVPRMLVVREHLLGENGRGELVPLETL